MDTYMMMTRLSPETLTKPEAVAKLNLLHERLEPGARNLVDALGLLGDAHPQDR